MDTASGSAAKGMDKWVFLWLGNITLLSYNFILATMGEGWFDKVTSTYTFRLNTLYGLAQVLGTVLAVLLNNRHQAASVWVKKAEGELVAEARAAA